MRPEHSLRRIIQHLDNIIVNNKKYEMKDTIIVAGSPRSGTTILMDVLGVIQDYKILFEPLNPLYYPETIKVGFESRTYLPPNADWKEGEEYLKKIFTGNVIYDSSWLEKGDYSKKNFGSYVYSYLDQIKPEKFIHQIMGNKLLIKFVGLNRLLPWVAERFQLRRMIFIIRHPCGYVASRLVPGYTPPDEVSIDIKPIPTSKDIINEASKINGLSPSLLNRLKKIKTVEEILAASWCMDTYVPLSYKKPHPWTLVTYEKLIKEGEKEIKRIFNEIGEKNIPRSAFRHLKMPSRSTHKTEEMIVKKADEQLSKWKKRLSKEQIESILDIVSAFGIDFYTENLEPDYENIGI